MAAHNEMSLSICRYCMFKLLLPLWVTTKGIKSQEAQHSQQGRDHGHRNPHSTRASEKKQAGRGAARICKNPRVAGGGFQKVGPSAFKFLGVDKALQWKE